MKLLLALTVAILLAGCMSLKVAVPLSNGTVATVEYKRVLMKLDATATFPDGTLLHITSDPQPAVDLSANALQALMAAAKGAAK